MSGPPKDFLCAQNVLVFTEQGVAMLSSVLKSEKAINVNIQIMRAFVKLKTMRESHMDIRLRIEEIEKKYDSLDEKVTAILCVLGGQEESEPWTATFGPVGFLKN